MLQGDNDLQLEHSASCALSAISAIFNAAKQKIPRKLQ